MKKLHAALGVLACSVGGAALAQSSVTVSGLVDIGLQSGKVLGTTENTTQMLSGGMTTSWFGFTGTEDLGGGLKAGFKLTAFFVPSIGVYGRNIPGDTLFSRDAAVSLSGGFGSVVLGRQIDPAFVPIVAFNPFGDSFQYSPLVFHSYLDTAFTNYQAPLFSTDSGWNSTVTYVTPNFGGLSGSVSYEPGGIAGKTSASNYGANVLYFSGTFSGAAFYQDDDLTSPGTSAQLSSKVRTYGVSGAYDLQVVKLFANYFNSKNQISPNLPTSNDKIFNVGASVPVGAGNVMVDWADTKSDGSVLNVKWTTISLGYDYFLSKRTDVYANDMINKETALDHSNVFGVGIRHRF